MLGTFCVQAKKQDRIIHCIIQIFNIGMVKNKRILDYADKQTDLSLN